MTTDRSDNVEDKASAGSLAKLLACADADRDQDLFRIGDLSEEFGITLRTLRFYEDKGLLSPSRQKSTRLYSRRDRTRLRLALIARALGFSLVEARQMIDLFDQPDGQRLQLENALERFAEQEAVLREQKEDIEAALGAMEHLTHLMRQRLASL